MYCPANNSPISTAPFALALLRRFGGPFLPWGPPLLVGAPRQDQNGLAAIVDLFTGQHTSLLKGTRDQGPERGRATVCRLILGWSASAARP